MAVDKIEVGKTYSGGDGTIEWMVTAIGEERLLVRVTSIRGESTSEPETVWRINHAKELWTEKPVFPEGWMNVYKNSPHGTSLRESRDAADRAAFGSRIGVLHLFPDGHTEMEAP